MGERHAQHFALDQGEIIESGGLENLTNSQIAQIYAMLSGQGEPCVPCCLAIDFGVSQKNSSARTYPCTYVGNIWATAEANIMNDFFRRKQVDGTKPIYLL